MSPKTELLAPAKNKETAFTAIDCGADAVYIGAPVFGARQNASNSLDDIKEVVEYAHKYWVKVHVTVNTILTDAELDEAVKLVQKLSEIGVDAIIVQDMGLIERLMSADFCLPQIHMSTQCDNYLLQKIKFFKEIGASRVVLARELSIEQIKLIHNEVPDIELESFIHGALCVSMSGQCYLSQYIGGRSANRGECAQPCRKKYDVLDDKGNIIAGDIYPLCLKDFNGSKCIDELISAGVTSFKIEGRLKDEGYVKNIVAYYRGLIPYKSSSGKSVYPFSPNPEKGFNRGFTEYFLKGRGECFNFESPKSRGEYIGKVVNVNKDSFEVKTGVETHPQDGLYFNGDGCLINKVNINKGITTIWPNKKIEIKAGALIYRNSDIKFEKELKQPVKRQIGVFIKIDKSIDVTDEDGVSVSIDIPSGEKAKNPDIIRENFVRQLSKTGNEDFYIEDIKVATDAVLPFVPLSGINTLRHQLFEKLMNRRIDVYNQNKPKQQFLRHAEFYKKELDYRANVHNSSARAFYEKCGVNITAQSFESFEPDSGVELMRCRHCIKYALNMCKSPKKLFLRDSHNTIYPLKFNCKACEMSVIKP